MHGFVNNHPETHFVHSVLMVLTSHGYEVIKYYSGSFSDPLSVPSLTVDRVTNSAVEYQVRRNDDSPDAVITGYEVICFGVPMIGEYESIGRGSSYYQSCSTRCSVQEYTAWTLSYVRRSATPAVMDATTGEASQS